MLDLETWASGSILTGATILSLYFLCSYGKASDANISIISIVNGDFIERKISNYHDHRIKY